jgi:hypothetical protein
MSPLEIARVVLSAIIVIGFVVVLGVYSFIPPMKSDLIPGMVGIFGTGFMTVVYYWFPKLGA